MTRPALTQHQKILMLICKNPDKKWWLPHDFMHERLGYLFVGYEASARLSELAHDYPYMIESKTEGKYKARRIRFENIGQWFPDLPKELRYIFHKTGMTKELRLNPDEPKPASPILEPPIQESTRKIKYTAKYIGRTYSAGGYQTAQTYEIEINRMVMGKPIKLLAPIPRGYANPSAFHKDWRITQ